MTRILLVLLILASLIAIGIGFGSDPGQASLLWLNYRVDTTASAAVIIIGVMAFCAVVFWNLALWLARAPQRTERARAEARRRNGDEVLTRGFMAVASGDGAEARRNAVKAIDLCDNIALVRILNAMAAEVSDDTAAAKAAYTAMLSVPELKLAGLKGLVGMAEKRGDKAEAVRLAGEAYSQARPSMWAFKVLFEARLEAGEWQEALDLIDGAVSRKLVSPLFSERAKASLMAAMAARQEEAPDAAERDQAMDYAVRAARLQPQFTPAAVIAARLLKAARKAGRAEDVLEAAWTASPHPAIWLAYRDLVNDETPAARAKRLQKLIDRNPQHRESRLLQVERALLTGVKSDIAAAADALSDDTSDDRLTRRVCGVLARAAQALGDVDAARTWVARAAQVKGEPEWSDTDAEGKAFAYGAGDWSDLILAFARTAALTHPRFDRGEKGLPDIPDMASVYVPSMPFVRSARKRVAPLAQPDDPGAFDDAISGHDLDGDEPPAAKPVRARRTTVRTPK